MLRSRVIAISVVVLALVVLLEVLGAAAGRRVDATLAQALDWSREASLDAELEAYMVRAAGEAASALLANNEAYAAEAREAMARARIRLERLRSRDRAEDDLRHETAALRARQTAMFDQLTSALAPLSKLGERAPAETRTVDAVYAYEAGLSGLRQSTQAFTERALHLAEVRTARWRGIADGLSVLRLVTLCLLVFVLAQLLQRRIVSPLVQLSAAAEALSAGDFSARVTEEGGDEVGELQHAFNRMAAQLREYDDDSRRRRLQLTEALEQSEAALRSKADFVASISHELRTPMHGVIGMAELLLRDELDDDVRERVAAIHGSASALLSVINDILDFSKLEGEHAKLDAKPVNLRALADECVGLLSSRACERGVQLRAEVDAAVPMWLVGDGDRLRQVLNNLIGNAVKFTERGAVTIRARRVAEGTGRLRIEIEDTGIGIAADALQRIFEPFEQADGSIQRRHGGTGLGLAISRRLVVAMGGEIEVDSMPGEGSVFRFEIPLAACEPPDAEAATVGTIAPVGAHVLIVEDHPVNQALARRMMNKLGCTFELAADGGEAIEALSRSPFDLVLMDCHMPGMDGCSATRVIRAGEAGTPTRIPIIAMTAGAMDADRVAARDAGMDDFLAKPYSLTELQRVVERWVRSAA